jgi:polyphosphate glucokinase
MHVLGIDIGAEVIKGGVVDTLSGNIISDRYRTPTPSDSSPHTLMAKVFEVAKFFTWTGPIGVCLPSVVENGIVTDSIHLHDSWLDGDAETLFEEITDCPVSVLNDADAAGLAEMQFGAGREQNGLVVVLTIGTGIGSALFYNGVLIPNSELGRIEIQGQEAGQAASRKVRREEGMKKQMWARRVQSVLNTYERIFYPELFILGGWVSKKMDKLEPYVNIRTRMVAAELLNEAGVVGAALWARSKDKKLLRLELPGEDEA